MSYSFQKEDLGDCKLFVEPEFKHKGEWNRAAERQEGG